MAHDLSVETMQEVGVLFCGFGSVGIAMVQKPGAPMQFLVRKLEWFHHHCTCVCYIISIGRASGCTREWQNVLQLPISWLSIKV